MTSDAPHYSGESHLHLADTCLNEWGRFKEALVLYDLAYSDVSDEKAWYVIKQQGICYQKLGDHDQAIELFQEARTLTVDAKPIGQIDRDEAESLMRLGQYNDARRLLSDSFARLPFTDDPVNFAATLGFLGRLETCLGNYREARRHFYAADAILCLRGNGRVELYNKLALAEVLSTMERPIEARITALMCCRLGRRRDHHGRFGAPEHRRKALAMLIGGYRLYDWVKRHEAGFTALQQQIDQLRRYKLAVVMYWRTR